MYSVFDRVSKSDNGKAFVRQYKDDYNTQSVFVKLVDCYGKSTKAALESLNLLSHIISVCMDSSS